MTSRVIVGVLAALFVGLVTSNAAFAQFGGLLKKLDDKKEAPVDQSKEATNAGSPETAGLDAIAIQDRLVQSYLAANGEVTAGLIAFAKAYELKDEAAALEASATGLAGGAVIEEAQLEANAKQSAQLLEVVKTKIAAEEALSDDARATFVAGLIPFVRGITATADLPKEFGTFLDAAQSEVAAASLLDKGAVTKKLSTAFWLTKQVPGHSAMLLSGLTQVLGYAQKNGIPVPDDATKSLSLR